MTRPDWIDTLSAELRPVDPDPVLLAQLTQLSASSTAPAARPGRSAGARLAIVLGGAIAVGATSWAAGALPGTESPFRPEEQVTQQPTDPTPGGVRTPLSDAPTPPAGEQSSPAGGAQVGSPPTALPTAGGSATNGAPGVPEGVPPGVAVTTRLPDLPELPGLPKLPDVPATSLPPGLSHVPTVTVPRGSTSTRSSRTPRPQEVLVTQGR